MPGVLNLSYTGKCRSHRRDVTELALVAAVTSIIARFSSKEANFNPPHLHLSPRRGWSRSNLAVNFGVRQLRVPGLSCGVVCVILRLAVLIQYWSVTDRQCTDTQTDIRRHIPRLASSVCIVLLKHALKLKRHTVGLLIFHNAHNRLNSRPLAK